MQPYDVWVCVFESEFAIRGCVHPIVAVGSTVARVWPLVR
jgi:hypothetical protein